MTRISSSLSGKNFSEHRVPIVEDLEKKLGDFWAWLQKGAFLAIMILLLLGIVGVAQSSSLWSLWEELPGYSGRQFAALQHRVLPAITPERIRLNGVRNADSVSLLAHLVDALAQQGVRFDTGSSVFDLDLPMLHAAMREHPWVRDVNISRLPSGYLLLDVMEEEPRAFFRDAAQRLWLVNARGMAFKEISGNERAHYAGLLEASGEGAACFRPQPGLARAPHIESLETFEEKEECFLPELLAAYAQVPEGFERLVRADRLSFPGWKLWYQREGTAEVYFVKLSAKTLEVLVAQLRALRRLESEGQLSQRDVLGYDLRALPKRILVDFPTAPERDTDGS